MKSRIVILLLALASLVLQACSSHTESSGNVTPDEAARHQKKKADQG